MVGDALEALVGEAPSPEAVATALSTIPAGELAEALRLLARKHRASGVPLLRACLRARADWAVVAADALAAVATPAAADALAEAGRETPSKPVRTAVRRALYRLRQAGVTPSAAPPAAARPAPEPVARQAWMSAIDGTGSRGCWLVLEGPLGERTLLSAVLNDVTGLLDFAAGPIAKKRLEERLRAIQAESPLPWVEVPAGWAIHGLAEAGRRQAAAGAPLPGDLARWLPRLAPAESPGPPPVYARLARADVADDPALVEGSARLLELPELAGWFLDPAAAQSEALELLAAKESRLVLSDEVKAERRAAIVDRAIETHLGPEARPLWQRRLEEQAFVLAATGRDAEARQALAVAVALADAERPARRLPFVRALVERSLEVAGEGALGRLPADRASRVPPPVRAGAP